MRWRTQVEWRAQLKGCHFVRLCGGGFVPPTQEVVVVGVVIDVIVCLLVLSKLWCTIGIVCGLPVGFRWSVKSEWVTLWNRTVLLWVCFGTSHLAQLPVH